MTQSLAIFVGLGFVGLMFLGLGWGIVYSLTPEHRRGKILRWMLSWWIKGFVLPLALWCLMNIGLGWNLQPFMQEVQAAQNGKEPWFPEYLRVVGYGLFILSSYWAAVSLLWVLVTAARGLEGETRSDFRALCLTCSIAMLLPAAGIMYLGGWPLAGLAAMTMLTPIAGYAPNILQ